MVFPSPDHYTNLFSPDNTSFLLQATPLASKEKKHSFPHPVPHSASSSTRLTASSQRFLFSALYPVSLVYGPPAQLFLAHGLPLGLIFLNVNIHIHDTFTHLAFQHLDPPYYLECSCCQSPECLVLSDDYIRFASLSSVLSPLASRLSLFPYSFIGPVLASLFILCTRRGILETY